MKVRALAEPRRNAVRDLFHLHHLLAAGRVETGALADRLSSRAVRAAVDKVLAHDRERFEEEVAPFLPGDLAHAFAGRWDRIQHETAEALDRLVGRAS